MNESILKEIDRDLLEISSGDGRILISNRLQGRIFASIDGVLLHRLVEDLARNPDPVQFNNIGGNSLWPAPEGGDFAFNYPPDGDWMVQSGINSVPTRTELRSSEKVVIGKRITLANRKGEKVEVDFSREIAAAKCDFDLTDHGLKYTSYTSTDRLSVPAGISCEKVLLAAWSLEQFPGAEEVFAFGCCKKNSAEALNLDFYGDPRPRLSYKGNFWGFALGGEKRLQIGVSASAEPLWIGAYSPRRNLAVLRWTQLRPDGRYFNIADNEQKDGAFSAGDMFSVFNGSQELDFHELETIAPVNILPDGTLGSSVLQSRTLLLTGQNEKLRHFLIFEMGIPEAMLGEK